MSVIVALLVQATQAQWLATSAPIIQNQLVYESDTGNYKLGDGVSSYNELNYISNASPQGYLIITQLDNLYPFVGANTSSLASTVDPVVTTMALTDEIRVIVNGVKSEIDLSNFILSSGTSINNLPAATTLGANDTIIVDQNSTVGLTTSNLLGQFIINRIPLYFDKIVELTANTNLDPSVHNKALLVCSQPITISEGTLFVGSVFKCEIINVSSGNVTLGSGFITSSGSTTIASNNTATIRAFTYSGGNVYYANLGGSNTPVVGLTIGVNSLNIPAGNSIGVIGTVNPGGTAVQIGYSSSSTVQPTSWTNAAVSGYNITGSIAGLAIGTYYIWARETQTPSTTAVSGLVTVASYSIGITSIPSTGNTVSALSLNGTVAPNGVSVQIALSTSNTQIPTTGWVSATTTNGTWSGSITEATAGTYYVWAQQTGQPTISIVSTNTIVITAQSNSVTITSPPNSAIEGATLSLAGTVYPNNAAVQVQFGSSATVAPTGSWTAATVSGAGWTASLVAPSSAGTFYIWVEQTSGLGSPAVSPAVTISAPAGLTYSLISGSGNGSLTSTSIATFTSAATDWSSSITHSSTDVNPSINISPIGSINSVVFFWDTTATGTTIPTSTNTGNEESLVGGSIAVWYTNAQTGISPPAKMPSTPATPGTYYGKFAMYSGTAGTGTLLGIFTTSAITIT